MVQNPSSNHFRRYTLRDAAKDGRLVICKCPSCRRTLHYLASDIAELLGGDWDAAQPPFPCSRCGSDRNMFVAMRLPLPGDYGHLQVRRPGPIRKTQTWRNVLLGD